MIFGFGKNKINWEWFLQSACVLLEGDDKQFEWIIGRLKVILGDQYINFNEDSADYLFSKYRYRVISISYIIAALILKHKDEDIDENEYEDWKEKLQLLAVIGNPNEHFSISSKSIQHIGLENLKKPIVKFGKEEMESFHGDCAKLATLHLSSVGENGEGTNLEVGKALSNLYFSCFEIFVDGELGEEDLDLIINYISGQYRGQTNFAKSLIDS